jgi:hypothetical protein
MNITAQTIMEGPRLATRQWLAAIARFLKVRAGTPVPTSGFDRGVHDDCELDLPETDKLAVTIIKDALHRGASQLEVTRAAVAAARAVLPLVTKSKGDATAVVEAVEALIFNPNPQSVDVVSTARSKLEAVHEETQKIIEVDVREEFALYAVRAAAMASYYLLYADQLAVIAVECACEAAAPENNIAVVVTAALL